MRKGWFVVAASLVALGAARARPQDRPALPPLFERATAGLESATGMRVAFADLDGDGFPDAVIDRTKIFMNAPDGAGRRFVRSDHDDLESSKRRDVVQLGDVDGDGKLDLFLGRSTSLALHPDDDGLRNEIRLGDGRGGFAPVASSGVGALAETTTSACFVDFDRDGVLDLFVGNEYVAYGKSLEAFPDRLYRGRGDGTFEDVTEKAGLLGIAEVGKKDSRRPTYGVTHCDWNDDGWQDLLVMTYGRQANRLWRNNGDGTFTDKGEETTFDGDADRSGKYTDAVKKKLGMEDEQPFRANGNTFDAAVADFDGDGDLDVFLAEITHWWAGPSSDLSMLLVNQGKENGYRFQRRPDLIHRIHDGDHWNQGDLHAGWLDVDGDGLLDLVIASSDYPDDQLLKLYHQKEDHTFEEWTDRLGFRWVNATQISFGDWDGDGWTDLLVGTSHNRLTPEQKAKRPLEVGLFRNVCARALGNRFVNLRLIGGGRGKANREAIGAKVTLWSNGRRQTRIVQGGLGHAGHRDDTDCRFGVGKAETVDIEVRWPDRDGSIQKFTNVVSNRFYVLEQGGELREGRRTRKESGQ